MLKLLIYHPFELGASALLGSILWLFLTTWATNRRKRVNVPVVGPISGQNEKKGISDVNTNELIRRGYQKYPDQIFQIWNREYHYVIYPMRSADEVKDLPNDVADAAQATIEIFYPKYTQLSVDEHLITSVRRFLNQNLGDQSKKIIMSRGLREQGKLQLLEGMFQMACQFLILE